MGDPLHLCGVNRLPPRTVYMGTLASFDVNSGDDKATPWNTHSMEPLWNGDSSVDVDIPEWSSRRSSPAWCGAPEQVCAPRQSAGSGMPMERCLTPFRLTSPSNWVVKCFLPDIVGPTQCCLSHIGVPQTMFPLWNISVYLVVICHCILTYRRFHDNKAVEAQREINCYVV